MPETNPTLYEVEKEAMRLAGNFLSHIAMVESDNDMRVSERAENLLNIDRDRAAGRQHFDANEAAYRELATIDAHKHGKTIHAGAYVVGQEAQAEATVLAFDAAAEEIAS